MRVARLSKRQQDESQCLRLFWCVCVCVRWLIRLINEINGRSRWRYECMINDLNTTYPSIALSPWYLRLCPHPDITSWPMCLLPSTMYYTPTITRFHVLACVWCDKSKSMCPYACHAWLLLSYRWTDIYSKSQTLQHHKWYICIYVRIGRSASVTGVVCSATTTHLIFNINWINHQMNIRKKKKWTQHIRWLAAAMSRGRAITIHCDALWFLWKLFIYRSELSIFDINR